MRRARLGCSAPRGCGATRGTSGIGRTLRNLLFTNRGDGNFQYNDWLYLPVADED